MENYYVDKDSILQQIPNNYYIDENNILHKNPYKAPWSIIISLDIIITLITTSILIHKNKMIKQKLVTKDYLDKNGVTFTRRENNLIKEYVTHVTQDTYSGSSGSGGGRPG